MKNILFRFYFADRRQVDLIIIFREYINTLARLRAYWGRFAAAHFGQLSPVGNGRQKGQLNLILSNCTHNHFPANLCASLCKCVLYPSRIKNRRILSTRPMPKPKPKPKPQIQSESPSQHIFHVDGIDCVMQNICKCHKYRQRLHLRLLCRAVFFSQCSYLCVSGFFFLLVFPLFSFLLLFQRNIVRWGLWRVATSTGDLRDLWNLSGQLGVGAMDTWSTKVSSSAWLSWLKVGVCLFAFMRLSAFSER